MTMTKSEWRKARQPVLSFEHSGFLRHSSFVIRASSLLERQLMKDLDKKIDIVRGDITDADFAKARQAGLTDGEIVETVANVALNIFTNYVNHVAHTVVDFPEVAPGVEVGMARARRA